MTNPSNDTSLQDISRLSYGSGSSIGTVPSDAERYLDDMEGIRLQGLLENGLPPGGPIDIVGPRRFMRGRRRHFLGTHQGSPGRGPYDRYL